MKHFKAQMNMHIFKRTSLALGIILVFAHCNILPDDRSKEFKNNASKSELEVNRFTIDPAAAKLAAQTDKKKKQKTDDTLDEVLDEVKDLKKKIKKLTSDCINCANDGSQQKKQAGDLVALFTLPGDAAKEDASHLINKFLTTNPSPERPYPLDESGNIEKDANGNDKYINPLVLGELIGEERIRFSENEDGGAYFFRKGGKIKSTQTSFFLLPEFYPKLYSNEEKREAAKQKMSQSCSTTLYYTSAFSSVRFDLSEFMLDDFEPALAESLVPNGGPLTLRNIEKQKPDLGISDKILELLTPETIVSEDGNYDQFFAFCFSDDDKIKIWAIEDNAIFESSHMDSGDKGIRVHFKFTSPSSEIKKVLFGDPSNALSELQHADSDENMFFSDTYVHTIDLNLPSLKSLKKIIEEKAPLLPTEPSATAKTIEKNVDETKTTGDVPGVLATKSSDQTSEAILDKDKDNAEKSSDAKPKPKQPKIAQPKAPTIKSKPKKVNARKKGPKKTTPPKQSSSIPPLNTWLVSSQTPTELTEEDPFFSTLLKRISKVFYNPCTLDSSNKIKGRTPCSKTEQGTYLKLKLKGDDPVKYAPLDSDFVLGWVKSGDEIKPKLPNNSFWRNKDVFYAAKGKKTTELPLSECPLVRRLSFNSNMKAPTMAYDQSYIKGSDFSRSIADLAIDQFWVDAHKDPSKSPSKIDLNGAEMGIKMLVDGAFASPPSGSFSLKNNQHMELIFCLDPKKSQFDIFWQSDETKVKWTENPSIKVKYSSANSRNYLGLAKKGQFPEKCTECKKREQNPLVLNLSSWYSASYDIHLDIEDSSKGYDDFKDALKGAPDLQKILTNRGEKPPTVNRIVCDKDSKCYLVFQATFPRWIHPGMMSFFVETPSSKNIKVLQDIAPALAAAPNTIYNAIFDNMSMHQSRKPIETTFFGAFEIGDLKATDTNVDFISFNTLKKAGLYVSKDKDIYADNADGHVYFVGQSADMYLPITVEKNL